MIRRVVRVGGTVGDRCRPRKSHPDVRGTLTGVSGANLTNANISNAALAGYIINPCMPSSACSGSAFNDANLTGDNTTDTVLAGTAGGIDVSSGSADLAGATLTATDFTGTVLVPSNQSVTATSQNSAVATWSTPTGLPGATPGSCTPATGSTFHLFSNTVTCQVIDNNGDVATGTFAVSVTPTTNYFTWVGVPSNGAALSGQQSLDAAAADGPGVTMVGFEVSGGC